MAQLELLNLSVHFGGVKAVQNVSIRVEQGEFRGLIGPNGAGKTTVFNAITGVVQPTAGDVYFEGQRLNGIRADKIAHMGIARTFQNIRIYPKMTAAENVAIVLIEHHLEVVMEVCQNIDVLNLGTMLASGTPDEIQKNPDVIKAYLGERRKRNGK